MQQIGIFTSSDPNDVITRTNEFIQQLADPNATDDIKLKISSVVDSNCKITTTYTTLVVFEV